MSRSTSRLVNLGLLTAALAGGLGLFLTRNTPTSAEVQARENHVFPFFRSEELQEIELSSLRDTKLQTKIRRDPRAEEQLGFLLGASGEISADPTQVSELLRALEFATWLRRIPEEEARPAEWGLQSPELEVKLRFNSNQAQLQIGAPAEVPPNSYYVRVQSGDGVPRFGVVSGQFITRLREDQRALRGRLLFPYAKSELRRFELERPDGKLDWTADERGFRLGEARLRAEREATDLVLFQLARVQLSQFLEDEEAEQLLERSPDTLKIRQIPERGAPVEVWLGAPCPAHPELIVAQRRAPEPLSGCVSRGVLPGLDVSPNTLISLTLSPLRADELDHLLLETRSGKLDLLRRGSAFELTTSTTRAVPLELGNDYLNAWTKTLGELSTEPLPTRPPDGTVTLAGPLESTANADAEERAAHFKLRFWDEKRSFVVEREDDGARLHFTEEQAWFLRGDTSWSQPRELLELEEKNVREIVARVNGQTTILSRGEDGLELASPRGHSLDAHLSGEWLRALRHVHVQSWLPSSSNVSRETQGELELNVEENGQLRKILLGFGPRTHGGVLAWSSETETKFVLPLSFVRLFQTQLIDRSAFLIDAKRVQYLELSAGELETRFQRRGERLERTSPTSSLDLTSQLEEALLGLLPRAAAHPGPARAEEGFARPSLILRGTQLDAEGKSSSFEIRLGALTLFQSHEVHFARTPRIDATFYLDRAAVHELLDLL